MSFNHMAYRPYISNKETIRSLYSPDKKESSEPLNIKEEEESVYLEDLGLDMEDEEDE